jgi:hypothetical protein
VPEIVFANLDEAFGRTEPDEEIQDLLKFSIGLNLALHYLQGAITYDPAVAAVDPILASKIVWLDCLLTNVDRTYRNTNMLMWNKELWLIDHGAALYFHHSWTHWKEHAQKPFAQIKDHVLLPQATALQKADVELRNVINEETIRSVVAALPDEWLEITFDESPAEVKEIYSQYLITRLESSSVSINEALNARKQLI